MRATEVATQDLRTSLIGAGQHLAQAIIDTAVGEIETIAARLYGLTGDEQGILLAQLDS